MVSKESTVRLIGNDYRRSWASATWLRKHHKLVAELLETYLIVSSFEKPDTVVSDKNLQKSSLQNWMVRRREFEFKVWICDDEHRADSERCGDEIDDIILILKTLKTIDYNYKKNVWDKFQTQFYS